MTAVLAVALILAGVDTGFTGYLEATVPASRVATECVTDADTCNPPITAPRAVWVHCEQWHDLAAYVGWPEQQGYVLQHVMWRESRCNPGAYNPTPCAHSDHAKGLLQLCGWSCPPGGCYDPESNLRRGRELWESMGWRPWCIPGDPVTGRCS